MLSFFNQILIRYSSELITSFMALSFWNKNNSLSFLSLFISHILQKYTLNICICYLNIYLLFASSCYHFHILLLSFLPNIPVRRFNSFSWEGEADDYYPPPMIKITINIINKVNV